MKKFLSPSAIISLGYFVGLALWAWGKVDFWVIALAVVVVPLFWIAEVVRDKRHEERERTNQTWIYAIAAVLLFSLMGLARLGLIPGEWVAFVGWAGAVAIATYFLYTGLLVRAIHQWQERRRAKGIYREEVEKKFPGEGFKRP